MKMVSTRSLLIVVVCLLTVSQFNAWAQSSQTPEQYSITQMNAMFGPAVTTQIYRDGQMAMQESSGPPANGFPKGMHTRTYYDLRGGKQYTVDLTNPASACGTGTFSGDWGDPFATYAGMIADDPSAKNAKAVGAETINGVPTKVFATIDPASKVEIKYWLDEMHHLIMRLEMTPAGAATQLLIEVKQVSYTKPAASLLALPAACRAAASAPAPPSEQERIAAETGGNGSNFANAIMPPASKSACNVVFKVVQAGSLQPIPGVKVGVDLQIDTNHMPSYNIGGPQTFSGGHIQNMTDQVRNGALHMANVPSAFDMELVLGQNGGASALIYRQCFGPETTLLFVVKDPQNVGKGGDWLWAKK